MEILNNIWNALSTENEALINILFIPLYFVEAYLSLLLFINILNIKATKKQKIIYVVLSSIVALITNNFLPEPFNMFINYILLFTINYFNFKMNILKTILSVIMPTIAFGLIGTLILNPFVKIINMDYNIAQFIPIYRLSYLGISYIILSVLIIFIKNKNIYLNTLDELDKKTKFMLIISFILGLIVLCIQLSITVYYTNTLPIIISILSFICLLAYFSISIYSLTRVIKLTVTKKQLQNAEEYNKTLQILHDNVRCFKHDFDNIVTTIGGYIRTNDMQGLEKYYKQLEEDCLKVNNLYMLNPNVINNPGIYSLLTNKYYKAENLDIKLTITSLLDLNTINMKIYEFSRILGILLDNSIEAASKCDEKIINITFRNDDKNNRQLVIIENTYSNKDVDLDEIFEKGVTGKENHTGLGLWEIRKILKRNNNLNLHTTKSDKFFTQQFEIYKN